MAVLFLGLGNGQLHAQDTTNPRLFGLTISPASLDVSSGGGSLTIIVTALPGLTAPSGAELDAVTLRIGRPNNAGFYTIGGDSDIGLTERDSIWSRQFAFPQGTPAGVYTIDRLLMRDSADGLALLSNAALVAERRTNGSIATSFTIRSGADAPVAATITTQPIGKSVVVGTSVTFSVAASGTAPLTYQWYRDTDADGVADAGEIISGATSSTYTISSPAVTDAGKYLVVVSNAAGDVTSQAATLAVTTTAVAPTITTQPAARTIDVGDAATFSVVASGTAPLRYQWRKDGTAIAGATGSTYALSDAVRADAGAYSVVVTNGVGNVTSSVANLTVRSLRLTSFTVSPAFRSSPSEVVTFRASTNDDSSAMIAFRLRAPNGVTFNPSLGRGGDGGFFSEIPIPPSRFRHGEWEISSVTVTSDSTVTYSYEDLAAAGFDNGFFAGPPPTFKVHPPDITVAGGFWIEVDVQVNHTQVQDRNDDTRTFPVNAWHLVLPDRTLQSDTSIYTNFADAVSAKLLFGPITASDAGDFRIRATNPFGSVDSASRSLTVTTAVPRRAVHVGERTILSAPSTAIGVFRYQWLKDGFDIPGATDSNYAIDPIRLDDAGLYSLRITDPYLRSSLVHRLRLTVSHPPVAPAITSQPVATSVVEGNDASFGVRASGTAPLSYEWRKDGDAIAGATAATYEITNAQLADAGSYSVVVSNVAGRVTSAAAALTVTEAIIAPVITSQPASATVEEGDAASFSVTASGTAPLTWQWRRDGNAIAGATAPAYEIAGTTLADAGEYSVVVSNSAGSATSRTATLAVLEEEAEAVAPTILSQPASVTVDEGDFVSFRVTASGTAPFAYQWRKDGRAIVGATAATYVIAGTQLTDAGAYSVVVTNEAGSVTSAAAALTVTEAIVAPAVTSPPVAMAVVVGGAASFSVAATGSAPLSYEWRKDGRAIPGATSSTHAIADAQLADAGDYSVVVSNAAGSATSPAAALTVMEEAVAPAILSQPVALTVDAGDAASFSVTVSGTAPFTYEWRRDGRAIAGATAATYAIAEAQPADAGDYSVVVSNEAGSVTSSAAALAVTQRSVLSNLSVRATLQESRILVVGAVVSGGRRDLLIRAAGPALDAFGLEGLPDPQITLFGPPPAGEMIGENDDWNLDLTDTFAAVGAFAFEPGSRDSAYVLEADGLVTVHVAGKGGAGAVLVEAYRLPAASGARLSNVSARNFAGAGDDMFIVGFAIAGPRSHRVLIRAVGPTLGERGITGFLADPAMTLFDRDGDAIMSNDDWDLALAETFAAVGAFPLPAASKDAGLVAELAPGVYTVQVRGVDEGTGEALIEVYEILE